jgi:predicted Zn-dependent peptidase
MPKSQTISDQDIHKVRLENGSTLLVRPFEGAPRLALSIFVPGGNLLDTVPGFSDVVDRLLMKGTHTRTQEQISIEIDSLTLEVDTDTKRDYSLIAATLLEEDLEPSLALISDLFFESTLAEFDREREKIAGEIHMDMDSPRSRASDQFVRTLFHETPYSAVGSLILENLPRMGTIENAQEHYRRVYRPDRMIVSVVGDGLQPDRMASLLERYFPENGASGAATGTASYTLLQNLQIESDQYVTFARDDSSQAHIFKGWLTPDLRHDDYSPLVVLNTILGGAGLSSRLFLELRDKQGLAYNVRSSFEAYKHRGMFYLYIGTEPKNKERCLNGFIEECGKLMDTPVSAQELAEAKQNILGRRTVFLETAPQQASYIGANYTLGRSLEEIAGQMERIQAVTSEDVQRVAQTYFSQPSVISVVGPSSIL